MIIEPIQQDYERLWAVNPLAAEQLKSIVLTRLLLEKEAESAIPPRQEEAKDKTPNAKS